MKAPFKINFLDMIIQDTGNSDRITLVGKDGEFTGCSIGNFNDLKTAKIWAVRWFMLQRPGIFGHQVWLRMNEVGSGCYHEWYAFKKFCASKGIDIHSDITCSDDRNFSIMCCGMAV